MSTITFRDFTLNQTTITGKRKSEVVVVDAHARYKIDPETRQKTTEVDGYSVDILAQHGRSQTVKLPKETEKTIGQIIDALKNNMIVSVNFGEPSTLVGRCYAMNNQGSIISGVSACASEINIVRIEADEDYADDVIDM